MFLYDATYLYLILLNETLSKGGSPRNNGDKFFQMARQREFYGTLFSTKDLFGFNMLSLANKLNLDTSYRKITDNSLVTNQVYPDIWSLKSGKLLVNVKSQYRLCGYNMTRIYDV